MADMAENKDKQNDLESGDNREERTRTSGKAEEKQNKPKDGQKDLESGDNPEERKRMAPK